MYGLATPLDERSAPSHRPLSYNTHDSQQTDIHAPGGIRTHSPSNLAAADPRLRQRGHWDRLVGSTLLVQYMVFILAYYA